MDRNFIWKSKGFSLIELLVGLVISSMVMAGLYRSVINQQKAYAIQDEVTDMQQNLRNAIDRLTREIRMAGYGVDPSLTGFGNNVNSFNTIVTQGSSSVTILKAVAVGNLTSPAATGTNQLQLNVNVFNTGQKRYLYLNGRNSNNYLVQSVNGNQVTLTSSLSEGHLAGEPVYLVQAITFRISPNTTDLVMNGNTGDGDQIIAENIEGLQFGYSLSGTTVQMVSFTITGRTKNRDPQYSGDGYRRQTVGSVVELRNMGL